MSRHLETKKGGQQTHGHNGNGNGAVMKGKDTNIVYILRGLPGSGKSRLGTFITYIIHHCHPVALILSCIVY